MARFMELSIGEDNALTWGHFFCCGDGWYFCCDVFDVVLAVRPPPSHGVSPVLGDERARLFRSSFLWRVEWAPPSLCGAEERRSLFWVLWLNR